MNTEFKLPNLGENIPGGDVVKVLVTSGTSVKASDLLLEVETGKAVVEVPASVDMIIREVIVKAGDSVKIGQVLFLVDVAAQPQELAMAPVPVEAPPPVVTGQIAPPDVAESLPPPAMAPAVVVAAAQGTPSPRDAIPVPAAPSVRREARELGVDIRQVKGSGPGGRIGMGDVRAFVREQNRNVGSVVSAGVGDARVPMHTELPDFSLWGEVRREKMKTVRRATAHHMAATWNTVPQVTCYDKADITRLEALRLQFAPRVQKKGGKLSVTAIMLKVIASALKLFPQFNASVDGATDEIIFKRYIHIGCAVDTPRGLIVPVIRNVDRLNFTEIAVALTAVSETARAGKTAPEDMRGGCFTVSNLGGIGGVGFSPIINYPEVAILGMSRGVVEAVHVAGQFEPRLLLPLSLSFDHRVIDGADGARFLRWICEAIEEPMILSLEG